MITQEVRDLAQKLAESTIRSGALKEEVIDLFKDYLVKLSVEITFSKDFIEKAKLVLEELQVQPNSIQFKMYLEIVTIAYQKDGCFRFCKDLAIALAKKTNCPLSTATTWISNMINHIRSVERNSTIPHFKVSGSSPTVIRNLVHYIETRS